MLDENEIKQLLEELKATEKDVIELRKKLNQASKRREEIFSRKDSVSGQIRSRIGELSDSKVKRNQITNEVREKKRQRDEYNSKINAEVAVIKKMKADFEAVKSKLGLKDDPKDLTRQIEQLEFKMQTDAMSFDKEQKVMKTIKELKKKAGEAKELIDKSREIRNKSKEIDDLKKIANGLHKEIQDEAAKSQSHHEELIEKYKSIDEIRKGEDELKEKVEEFRKEFNTVNDEMKVKLDKLKGIKQKLEENNVAFEESVREKTKVNLDEKRKEVEAKMKGGKTLTTEDLLILQGSFKQ